MKRYYYKDNLDIIDRLTNNIIAHTHTLELAILIVESLNETHRLGRVNSITSA